MRWPSASRSSVAMLCHALSLCAGLIGLGADGRDRGRKPRPPVWQAAGTLKANLRRVSLADCFAIELAERHKAAILTADHPRIRCSCRAADVPDSVHPLMILWGVKALRTTLLRLVRTHFLDCSPSSRRHRGESRPPGASALGQRLAVACGNSGKALPYTSPLVKVLSFAAQYNRHIWHAIRARSVSPESPWWPRFFLSEPFVLRRKPAPDCPLRRASIMWAGFPSTG
jgi:hypothetical protein